MIVGCVRDGRRAPEYPLARDPKKDHRHHCRMVAATMNSRLPPLGSYVCVCIFIICVCMCFSVSHKIRCLGLLLPERSQGKTIMVAGHDGCRLKTTMEGVYVVVCVY